MKHRVRRRGLPQQPQEPPAFLLAPVARRRPAEEPKLGRREAAAAARAAPVRGEFPEPKLAEHVVDVAAAGGSRLIRTVYCSVGAAVPAVATVPPPSPCSSPLPIRGPVCHALPVLFEDEVRSQGQVLGDEPRGRGAPGGARVRAELEREEVVLGLLLLLRLIFF